MFPKFMRVSIVMAALTSTIHVLIITPVIFYLMKLRALRKRAGQSVRLVVDWKFAMTARHKEDIAESRFSQNRRF